MGAALCICNGLIRSGSTWSFNVCRELLGRVAAQHQKPFGSSYLHGPQLEYFVERQSQTAPGPTVIKAHELGPKILAALDAGTARGVCTFRDPRDSVASDMAFMGLGLDASIYRVNVSLECLRLCESTKHVLFMRYEEMMADRVPQIDRIARHIGIIPSPNLLAVVDANTNIQTSKKVCEQIKNRPADQVLQIESHRVDPHTHLHENHIGTAKVGRWKDDLSPEQGRYLTEYFAPWLLKWGYETQESLKQSVHDPV